ncbi:MAG: hypothetical protein ACRC7O_00640 [Fimbriiglobus sp.]
MDGNRNVIVTGDWSNPASRALYEAQWPGEPGCQLAYHEGRQCGGCSFFAAFDADWGLCAHPGSRHRLETVFEHFTCPTQVPEGWGPHNFSTDPDSWCLCGGEADYWQPLVVAVRRLQDAEPGAAANGGGT